MDAAAKDAAIAGFVHEYPEAADAGRGHPALDGCEEVRWSDFPECPAALPVLLYGLLDRAAAAEAQRVLTNVLMGIAEMNPAMPEVLRFLLPLAGDPQVPERSGLLHRLAMVADSSEPVDHGNEAMVLWFGSDSDHPERERCRAMFAQHSGVLAALPEGLIGPDSQAKLRQAAGLL
ncbi:hypothetical protein [Streptomyces griseoflavus]|uniref:Uncharacterized protein n=1 Tax=Streptomyces griseoflavus Tu4000 TaxID=467200 RepID=D9XKI9_9ACTN|nr:hypothetical protein [Streptomyces griseoflavus]EFL37351.1 hypothetical protein SSRG_00155 [Streptomyces griseoflavus Tu4000]